jgi:hypothetical protein
VFERNKLKIQNFFDDDGNPAGGTVEGKGLSVTFQDGPLGRPDENGVLPESNGAYVEDLLEGAMERLLFYQRSDFNCRENAIAITKIEEAQMWLLRRRTERESRKVQGTNNP